MSSWSAEGRIASPRAAPTSGASQLLPSWAEQHEQRGRHHRLDLRQRQFARVAPILQVEIHGVADQHGVFESPRLPALVRSSR
jgi:hypothetical protein